MPRLGEISRAIHETNISDIQQLQNDLETAYRLRRGRGECTEKIREKVDSTLGQLYETLLSKATKRIHREIQKFREIIHQLSISVAESEQDKIGGREGSVGRQVANSLTPDSFRKLFKSRGIPGNKWHSSSWLSQSGHSQIYNVILRDPRFGSWPAFKKFMGIKVEETYSSQIGRCDSPSRFHKLFSECDVPREKRLNSTWLNENGYSGLYWAIVHDVRFEDWDAFKQFMGKEVEVSPADQIAPLKTPADFLRFFRKVKKMPEDSWQSSQWMNENGFSGLCKAISNDSRFGSWVGFKEFMGITTIPWTKIVAQCITPTDFINLFRKQQIPGAKWQSSTWLTRNGHSGMYQAIAKDERFGVWTAFKQFMGVDEESDSDAQSEFEQLAELKLEDAIALLRDDPLKLKLYLQFAHPEFTEEEIDRLVIRSFKGLSAQSNETKETEYLGYEEKLRKPRITQKPPQKTEENTVTISGQAEGADAVYVAGSWNRRLRVEADGMFTAVIPLKVGESNEIKVMGINRQKKLRSGQKRFVVEQEGESEDIQALVELLSDLGKEELRRIQKDPGKKEYLVQSAEQMLIKRFARSFEEGRNYVEGLIASSSSHVVQAILRKVLSNFRVVDRKKYPNVRPEEPLYFFQKYCVAAIQRKMEEGAPGVVLANDPGLGKTRTTWVAIREHDAIIVVPNSVVSTWGEEAAKCLRHSDILTLQDTSYPERMRLLAEHRSPHRVTNIEFLRDHRNEKRFQLLSDDDTVIVQDEAHSRTNLNSDQTIGARKLRGKFQLFLTATPAKDPVMLRRLLHNIYPDDKRFSSDQAFLKAFPADDPQALRTLSLIKQRSFIRFRKSDVMQEIDPDSPLEEQHDRLPRKEYVPPEKFGNFTMSEAQAWALYEMFLNWDQWTRKYNQYIPKDHVARKDNLRHGDSLTKRHALRQTVNNPEYINAHVDDAKTHEMRRIVEKCLRENRKVVIFCMYNAQARKYAELFKDLHPAVYTGLTSDEGKKRNPNHRPIRYRTNTEGGWALDERGYPIEDPEGQPMLALDFERLTFQNTEDRKLMIATYAAGAVGVTFTAGKAVIDDDIPPGCIVDIQHEDRTNRIDHEHQTHYEVKHFRMVSNYPERFLAQMRRRWVVKQENGTYREFRSQKEAGITAERLGTEAKSAFDTFFAQGTYDQVQLRNLRVERAVFHLINDGIADKSILEKDQQEFVGI